MRPNYERWYIEDEADQIRMIEALEAAIGLADCLAFGMQTPEQMGIFKGEPFDRDIMLLTQAEDGLRLAPFPLPPKAPVTYPPIVVNDDLSRTRLSKAPRKGEWAVKVFRHFQPLLPGYDDEDYVLFDDLEEPPIYPLALIIVEMKMGFVAGVTVSNSLEDYSPSFVSAITDAASNYGLPNKIIVIDDRTAQILGPFCEDFGITLQQKKRCKALQEALDDLIESFMNAEDGFDADESVRDDEIGAMFEMLRDTELLETMPEPMLKQLLSIPDPGVLPQDIWDALCREGVRRKLIKRS